MDPVLRQRIRRGARISATFTVLVLLGLLLLTVESQTFRVLRQLKPSVIIGLFFVWGLFVVLDGWRLQLIAQTGHENLSLRRAVEVILVGYFFAAVTPFQTGGFPFQIIILRKDQIGPGRAMAYLALRGILIYGFVYLLTPLMVLRFFQTTQSGLIRLLLHFLVVVVLVIAVLGGFVMVRPARSERLLERFRHRIPPILYRALRFVIAEAEEFRLIFGNVLRDAHGRRYFLYATLVSVAALLVYLSLAPLALYGLGVEPVNVLTVMGIQVLLMALLLYIPTPGAGGVAEMGGAALFALVCPKYLLGVYVILWRFFTFYLLAIAGGLIALKEF